MGFSITLAGLYFYQKYKRNPKDMELEFKNGCCLAVTAATTPSSLIISNRKSNELVSLVVGNDEEFGEDDGNAMINDRKK